MVILEIPIDTRKAMLTTVLAILRATRAIAIRCDTIQDRRIAGAAIVTITEAIRAALHAVRAILVRHLAAAVAAVIVAVAAEAPEDQVVVEDIKNNELYGFCFQRFAIT